MTKNESKLIKILSATVIVLALISTALYVAVYVNGCKELPEVEVSPELELVACVEACHIARDKGCERIGKLDLTSKACEPFCKDAVARVENPNWGCVLEALTCQEVGSCPM